MESLSINCTYTNNSVWVKRESADDINKILGEPVPGFEYKWETEDYERYKRLKDKAYNVDDDNRDCQQAPPKDL